MKNVAAVTLLVLSILVSGFALAKDVSGTIASVDWTIRHIVLDDGTAYSVERGINLAKFKPWDKVTLETDDAKGKTVVKRITGDTGLSSPVTKRKSHRS